MKKRWGIYIMFFLGFLICCLPMAYSIFTQRHQSDVVATYQNAVSNAGDEVAAVKEDAQEYNSMLYQSGGGVLDSLDTSILSEESYRSQLDQTGTGVMGSLDIPKINVELPIYHGTGKEELSQGIGHLEGTSLPIGGENTHCVLTGHRGLPQSKLLIRLDEMKKGDYFFIRCCNEVLAYKVLKIQTVEPDDVSGLQIQQGKDLASLVTCTPYGLNTHRLIVTGERVDYEETQYEEIEETIPSGREMLLTFLPVIFIAVMCVLYLKDRRNRRDLDENEKI